MSHAAISIYEALSGDSLSSVAHRFKLTSWRALSQAPGNVRLQLGAHDPLPPGTRIVIPPRAHVLLMDQFHLLTRLRASLLHHFHRQDELFHRDIGALTNPSALSTPAQIAGVLAALQERVAEDLELAALAAAPLASSNAGLVLTHLHAGRDMARFGGSPAAALHWLLTPPIVDAWHGMWGQALWRSRWRLALRASTDADLATAIEQAAMYLNVIRSKVVQQADRRVRECRTTVIRLGQEQ